MKFEILTHMYSSVFSVLCPHLKNVFFGKIHWAHFEILEVAEAIFEVAEAKIWISSIFEEFSFRIFTVLSFKVVWPQRPRRPQKGASESFQKLHFWNQCIATKKIRYGPNSHRQRRCAIVHFHCAPCSLFIEEPIVSQIQYVCLFLFYDNSFSECCI